jgi:hypothetical protein
MTLREPRGDDNAVGCEDEKRWGLGGEESNVTPWIQPMFQDKEANGS